MRSRPRPYYTRMRLYRRGKRRSAWPAPWRRCWCRLPPECRRRQAIRQGRAPAPPAFRREPDGAAARPFVLRFHQRQRGRERERGTPVGPWDGAGAAESGAARGHHLDPRRQVRGRFRRSHGAQPAGGNRGAADRGARVSGRAGDSGRVAAGGVLPGRRATAAGSVGVVLGPGIRRVQSGPEQRPERAAGVVADGEPRRRRYLGAGDPLYQLRGPRYGRRPRACGRRTAGAKPTGTSIYHVGGQGPDRGHGHGFYVQNRAG